MDGHRGFGDYVQMPGIKGDERPGPDKLGNGVALHAAYCIKWSAVGYKEYPLVINLGKEGITG